MLASSGLATPPCGVPRVFPLPPLMRRVPSASRSSIGALSHILMRRRTFRSTTRRATDFISSECGIVSKYFAALGGYLLWTHTGHTLAALPYLFLLACPLMHFVHNGHGHKLHG